MRLVVGALALGCLLQAGCASEPRTVSGGTIAAPSRGDSTTGRRLPDRGSGRRGAAPAAEREERRDAVALAVDAALRDLTAQLKAQAARGWPAHVPLSSQSPPRPVLAIRSIMNTTSRHLDMKELEGRLGEAILASEQVYLAASPREREEAMDERAYEDSMELDAPAEARTGVEDAVGLVLSGELADDVREVDGERTRTVVLRLAVVDARKRLALIKVSGEATEVDAR